MGTGSYFDKALCETNANLIGDMRMHLHGTRYDTIIGTGLSGTIFTARVAPGLSKKFAIVRKDKDGSHSGTKVEGQVGERWVFADDFVSTGRTLRRCLERMQEHHPESTFAGVYQYECSSFYTPRAAAEKWGKWITHISMGAEYGPLTRNEYMEKHPFRFVELTKPRQGWDERVRPLVKISPWNRIALDYVDPNGDPVFYDFDNSITIKHTDPQAAEMVQVVRDYERDGGNLRRMTGTRMDQFPRNFKTVVPKIPVDSMRQFAEAVTRADDALKPWTSAGFLSA